MTHWGKDVNAKSCTFAAMKTDRISALLAALIIWGTSEAFTEAKGNFLSERGIVEDRTDAKEGCSSENTVSAYTAEGVDPSDSLRRGFITESVVTGTRSAIDARKLSQTVSVVGRGAIEADMRPSLIQTISEQVPGLFATARGVMGYGVSTGSSGALSIRGLSGGSGRMLVLIDGHPQYMGIMGHPIADSYQSFLAEQVEVLRGPSSVIYGSNAMGGVVNIVTRKMKENGVKTHLHAGYGSYNTLETELTNRIRSGRLSTVASISYNRSDGHRQNMDFEQFGGYAKLGYEISKNWSISGDVNVTHFNASNAGLADELLEDADQSITRGISSLVLQNPNGALSLFYNWGNHWINDGYNPASEEPLEYRFDSHDDMMGASIYQTFTLFRGNLLTVGVDFFHFGGMAWNRYVEGDSAGTVSKLVDKTMNETAGYVDFRQDVFSNLTLNAGLRVDNHSEIGTEWIPQFGLSYHLPHAMEIKATVAKGFRYPNIREMYMFTPQNPDLEPESLWNYEIGFSQSGGNFSYGINIYYIDAENLITSVARQGATPLNMNTGETENSGVELTAAWRINDTWAVDGNYSFLHMSNPVVAAPEHNLHLGANFSKGKWNANTGLNYIAGLYTAVSPDTKENFVLWNLSAEYKVNGWLSLWGRGENLLAQKYEINEGYPMPKATVFAGININL